MLKAVCAGLAIFLLTASAEAEVSSSPVTMGETPIPPAQPAPAAAPTRLPAAFMDGFLSYDQSEGAAFIGRERRPLARADFFTAVGRPDLLKRSREAARRRLLLGLAGGLAIVAGVTTAAVAWSGVPDLNAPSCMVTFRHYNEVCVPDYKRRMDIGAGTLVSGIVIGLLLGGLAYSSSPDVLSRDEATALVAAHNAGLLKRLRAEQSALRVLPYASPQGGGFSAALRF